VAATVRITVLFDDGCPATCSQPSGTYFIRVITPNGVSGEAYFSM
jgi:hypothetical protein